MKTILHPILRLLLIITVLGALAACSSGGGSSVAALPDGGLTLPDGNVPLPGGDKGGPLSPPAIFLDDGPLPLSPVSGDANIIVDSGIAAMVFDGTGGLTKTADGIEVFSKLPIKFLSGEGVSDFSAGKDFITAQILTEPQSFEDPSMDGRYRHAIYLGGKKLKLTYADFGIWVATKHERTYDTDGNMTKEAIGVHTYGTFWTDTGGYTLSPAAGDYIGTAVALTQGGSDFAMISGEAKLKVDNTMQGTLTLAFKDYHTFILSNINADHSGNGSIYIYGSENLPSIQVQGDNKLGYSGLTFAPSWSLSCTIRGQFYGYTSASEAAGRYMITGEHGDGRLGAIVQGAFGVKK